VVFDRERYRASRLRYHDAQVTRRGYAARAQAVAAGAWLPVEALQEAITTAQDQRTARDAYRTLRRWAGVSSPDEAVLSLMRRLFVAAIFTITEAEAIRPEGEPIVLSAPRIVRPVAPRRRRGSGALAEALVNTHAASS
jgi:hypothetical protein